MEVKVYVNQDKSVSYILRYNQYNIDFFTLMCFFFVFSSLFINELHKYDS